ncbi:MAG: hypothetical protein GY861_12155 [bacterium]|nr:hypothetical protein [bacterium]
MAENLVSTPEDGVSNNVLYELNQSNNALDLISNHIHVIEYFDKYNQMRETCHNFVRGHQYDPNELKKYKDKRKDPIVFNQVKTSERTIMGMWINKKFAVKFSAQTPQDDDIGEILERLNIWTSNHQEDDYKDIDLVRQAWAGGNSFQECYMDVQEGMQPTMHTNNQNPFAVYWDPDSRDLITRKDARFVDRDSYWTYDKVHALAKQTKAHLNQSHVIENDLNEHFDDTNIAADRHHETKQERNGKFLVTERFYLVPGFQFFAELEDEKIILSKKDIPEFRQMHPNIIIQKEKIDKLHIAIVCEQYNSQEYIYNGEYHCQPRDPRSNKIIWPILEMVAEELAGEPQGFVEHEISPNKVINAMMSNIVASAKHSAAAATLIDPAAFISGREAQLAARHHSDSDRSFQVRPGRTRDAIMPIQKSQTNADHQYALDYSLNFLSEVSSTPPALQGIQESANTTGVLNAQRIEQGSTQLKPFMKNYLLFLKQRAKLRYYYWRTYNTEEMVFRVSDKTDPNMDPYITINELVPEQDALGNYTGVINKIKDINSAVYDIEIEEAVDSPSYRARQLEFIERMMNSKFIEADAGFAAGLLEEALRLADSPVKTRDFFKKYSTLIQQAHLAEMQLKQQTMAAQGQGQEIANEQNLQKYAQDEAMQTTPYGGVEGTSAQASSAANQQGVPS